MTVLELHADEYHADPCPVPSLNSSTARVLLEKTPAHAKAQHPRLSDLPPRKSTQTMDMGTAVHQILLKDDRIDVEAYADYKTLAARQWRDSVRAQGRVPMLEHQWEQAQDIARNVRLRIMQLDKPWAFTNGQPEVTLTWQDTYEDTWCRARLDWLRDDPYIEDLKVTGLSAEPNRWTRYLFNSGLDVQAAFYVRAVKHVKGVTPGFRWVVCESFPPYEVSIVELSEAAMAAAGAKVERALKVWAECLDTGCWPGYPPDTHIANVPAWQREEPVEGWDQDFGEVPF